VTHANGVIETITVGAYTVKASHLVTGTTRSAATGAMGAVDDLDLTTGVASPGGEGPWTFDTVDFGGGPWRDTNGEAPDFFVFECGGNDTITVTAILPDGKAGKPVAIARNAWKTTGIASKVASGDAAGIALETTSLLDPLGEPLARAATIKGVRIHGEPNGIDPLSISSVAPPRK